MKVEVRAREAEFIIVLSQAEGVGLYWALSDWAGDAADRHEKGPRATPMFDLFDALYSADAADIPREAE